MIVRAERSGDHPAIREVHDASFDTPNEADLVDALREAGRLWVSLVAAERDRVVGHVAFSPVTLLGATMGVGLAPLAVLPEYRRRGIGARLVREGLRVCAQSGYEWVVVLGDPRYYRRFGFTRASDWRVHDEYGGGDAFQVLELRDGTLPAEGGVVRYAREFAGFDDQALGRRQGS